MSEKEIFVDQQRWYRLLEDACGLMIAVMCGGVGMYEVKVRLNAEDVVTYRSSGKSYLDSLAREVAYDAEKYRDRWVLN